LKHEAEAMAVTTERMTRALNMSGKKKEGKKKSINIQTKKKNSSEANTTKGQHDNRQSKPTSQKKKARG
jgi:hypothetical protein